MTSFQTVEQIEVVKEVILPEVSKLNDLVTDKDHRDQTQFSPEQKTLEKGKWVCYYLYICHLRLRRQTNKQIIYHFNDIQAPVLHII